MVPFRQFGWMEVLIILLIALLIFGPSKLPQLGRAIGKTIREFRRSIAGETEERPGSDQAGEAGKEDTD